MSMRFLIHRQLTLIICTLLLVVLGMTGIISYSLLAEDYEKKMQHNHVVIAESLAANIAQFLQSAYEINSFIASYADVGNMDRSRQEKLLLDTVRQYPIFQLLAIVDTDGNQLVRSSGPLGNRAERGWFKKFMAEKKPFISKTYYSLTTETPVTTIVHGFYAEGALTGLVMADIEIKKLQEMVDGYTAGTGSYAYLLDSEGAVVVHPDKQQVSELYNYKTREKQVLLHDAAGKLLRDAKNNEITEPVGFTVAPSLQTIIAKVMAGETGTGKYTDLDGEEYICAYQAIELPGASAPWSLVVVQKRSAVMAFVQQAALQTGMVGMLVMVLAALLAFWFSRRMTKPLVEMVTATERVKTGDLAVWLTVRSGNEIGVLMDNFNEMVAELRQHREKLEGLVAERTAELEAVNQEVRAVNEALAHANEVLGVEVQARRKSEEHLLLKERQYGAITGLLTQSADEAGDIFATILSNAASLLGTANGFIGLFDEGGEYFYIHHRIGDIPTAIMEAIPAETGMHGQVYASGAACYVEDYQTYPYRMADTNLARVSSVVMVPFKRAGKVIGILSLSWMEEIHPIHQEDIAALQQFGDLASVALEKDVNRKQIAHMAFYDQLTGLQNRVSLARYMEQELLPGRQGDATGVFMVIDVDELKAVNDNFGHLAGDQIIVSAGRNIVAAVGAAEYVFRIGGDEFVVVLPGRMPREAVAEVAERLREQLCAEYEVAAEKLYLSASIGIALYPEDGETAAEIMKKADMAMYAAKKAGRNCWSFYEERLLKDTQEKLLLTNGLRRGLERNEFLLHYQPQYSIAGDTIVGFEALLRWNSAEHGAVPPMRFIPLAEQSGLIIPIGLWVLQQACRFARRLADSGQGHLRVAVNISPRQLLAADVVERVQGVVQEAGIAPEQLEIEITESVLIESLDEGVAKLVQLQELGIDIALDDFGTGYSSLTYLRRLPVKLLKIDKSFIDKIAEADAERNLVGSIIQVGHALGLKLVAEGVETMAQLQVLRDLGCDHIQGYVFSKPVDEEAAVALVAPASFLEMPRE